MTEFNNVKALFYNKHVYIYTQTQRLTYHAGNALYLLGWKTLYLPIKRARTESRAMILPPRSTATAIPMTAGVATTSSVSEASPRNTS
jgi:hypothetical protein